MKELIFLVKDLISKIKSDSATLLDYINTLDAILHFLREFISGPVIGENPDDTEQLLGVCSELGLEVPKGGPVISIALQLLLKYILEQFLKNN